jgi:acetoin utilization deacetylase AcuC-like enzyme/GNAT superfamily N-acetyltransferase
VFRIRSLQGATSSDRKTLRRVQALLARRLPGLHRGEIDKLPDMLLDPVGHQFRALLFVAEDGVRFLGFALVSHDPQLRFSYLDYLATTERLNPGGVGGALYNRVREAARALGAVGLFFECLPDEPERVSDPKFVKPNQARLRFYERLGARPIEGTGYETPVKPGDKDLPHLVFDDLGRRRPLRRGTAQQVVRAILERKYAHLCPPEYVDRVVASFRDDPIRLRQRRYGGAPPTLKALPQNAEPIALVVNDRHQIHHIRERGYVESPARIKAVLDGIIPTGLFKRIEPRTFSERRIRMTHDPALVDYLKRTCASAEQGQSIYPYVFPLRNTARPPRDLAYCAGYYCIDTFTPIHRNAFRAAKRAVDCALTAADAILRGESWAYALVRPPGHHAERRVFGGFCYFNNAAIAADYLSARGKVAILDVDYHHGNGQQEIFYQRSDVLTVSIHGDPRVAYPFFTGFADERGAGAGEGYNLNIPLPEEVEGPRYRRALRQAAEAIERFAPRYLVVCLGFDTAKKDPTGGWSLGPADFEENGRMIAALGLPTLVVQEGGYRSASLGQHARRFFQGLVTR